MKTPQVKPSWNTGIYIGSGVIAKPTPEDNLERKRLEALQGYIELIYPEDRKPHLYIVTYINKHGDLEVGSEHACNKSSARNQFDNHMLGTGKYTIETIRRAE